ncbi:hypothetical protein C8J57DRAFT_1179460, partial [Mycena rebaudengoi]
MNSNAPNLTTTNEFNKFPDSGPEKLGENQLQFSTAVTTHSTGDENTQLQQIPAAVEPDENDSAKNRSPEDNSYLAGRHQHLPRSRSFRQTLYEMRDREAEHFLNLAIFFGEQYRKSGDLEDLKAALKNGQAAVAQAPEGPVRAVCHYTLGVSLREQYQISGALEDLNAVLHNHQECVAQTPEGHPDLALRFHNLGLAFSAQYQRLDDSQHLQAALDNIQASVMLTPAGNPARLHDLALAFGLRYRRTHDLKDLEAALQHNQTS